MKKFKKDKTLKLDMNDQEFLDLAKEAHALDITFNHLVERKISAGLIDMTMRLATDSINELKTKNEKKQSSYRRTKSTVTSSSRAPYKKVSGHRA